MSAVQASATGGGVHMHESKGGAGAHCWKCCFQLARSMEDSDSSMRLEDMMPRMRTSMSKLPRSSCAQAAQLVNARA